MKIGYISRHNLELNPHLTKKFEFIECSYTRKITSKSDKIYSKKFYPFYYEDVEFSTKMMKKDGLILVQEPFFLDNELREKAIKWCEWANSVEPEEYDIYEKWKKENNK